MAAFASAESVMLFIVVGCKQRVEIVIARIRELLKCGLLIVLRGLEGFRGSVTAAAAGRCWSMCLRVWSVERKEGRAMRTA